MINCPNSEACRYKSHCPCVNEAMREDKKRSRDKKVTATQRALNTNKIPFTESAIENIVVISPPNNPQINLSLKSDRDNSYAIYKFKIVGSKWQSMRKEEFFNWIKPQFGFQVKTATVKIMPFGKYDGHIITPELVAEDKRYFEWLTMQNFVKPDLKTTIINLLK